MSNCWVSSQHEGCQVTAFKSPSSLELDHDYLWRCNLSLPERGRIGIFNRSYYEEVLVVRVHPEFLAAQRLPAQPKGDRIWKQRFLERIENPEKNWKLSQTSTAYAPWHVIPADKKWFSRVAIANVIVRALESMKLKYPELNERQRTELEESKTLLQEEP